MLYNIRIVHILGSTGIVIKAQMHRPAVQLKCNVGTSPECVPDTSCIHFGCILLAFCDKKVWQLIKSCYSFVAKFWACTNPSREHSGRVSCAFQECLPYVPYISHVRSRCIPHSLWKCLACFPGTCKCYCNLGLSCTALTQFVLHITALRFTYSCLKFHRA